MMSGGPRNKFGQTVENGYLNGNNVVWSPALANIDSDGDGFTNGQELQDPNGLWTAGATQPGDLNKVTNPGNANSFPTGVLEELADYQFSFNSVSPNPFSNTVNVSYTLAKPSMVFVAIYDIESNLIKNLLFENQNSGNYQINWDATNNLGNRVQMGIYFVQIRCNNNSIFKKIILN
jgi:hypothetical protein